MKPNEDDWRRAALVCCEVAELPDRTSTDLNPDEMVVTGDELQPIVAAALAEARAQSGWRPIETAPKEVKAVIGWCIVPSGDCPRIVTRRRSLWWAYGCPQLVTYYLPGGILRPEPPITEKEH